MHQRKYGLLMLLFLLILGWRGAAVLAQNPHAQLPDDPAICSACHQPDTLGYHWLGSAHEQAEVPCTACHTDLADPEPDQRRTEQTTVCLDCHTRVRADIQRPFGHSFRDGQMQCTDCHSPHGGAGPADLSHSTVNDQCQQCHAETRGPFLWEHAPVTEDCGHCHQPHGSNHKSLLQARTPWLCQQCHIAPFHPSNAESGLGVPPEGASSNMLGQDCSNCHIQIHGSNHPSGSGLTR